MNYSRFSVIVLASAVCLALSAADAAAQRRGAGRTGGAIGHAVPRGSVRGARPVVVAPRIVSPRVIVRTPYRPYYYGYRPGFSLGIYTGFGYPYRYGYPYMSGYPYRYGYPYGYAYPYGYGNFYPYSYSGYGGYAYPLPPAAYGGYAYGGVRIHGAPRDAQVFADGYYVGIVDDFDGAFQRLELEDGPHQIEIRAPGLPPLTYDVNVQPGQTLTIHVR